MKKPIFLMIMIIVLCAFCACGKQDIDTEDNTNAGTEQAVTTESGTESTTSTESSTESTTATESTAISTTAAENSTGNSFKEASYAELTGILDEINTDINPEADGTEAESIKTAAHLLNWGVGTTLTTDEIKEKTAEWLSDKGDSEQAEFSQKLAAVYDSYLKLLGEDAQKLLDDAGCEDAAYPWSDSPIETVEAIAEAAGLPADTVVLVNLRGDLTTVYLLEDGRYMNRAEEVFIYDGIDTWTDESGVEWSKTLE